LTSSILRSASPLHLDRLRRRLLFLDDPTALLHLGFAVAMASLLLGLSLGMAWVLVEFVLS
jgi:hypothetical protein